MERVLNTLSILFLGTLAINVLWALLQPWVERKPPIRLIRFFLCVQGAVLLAVGGVVAFYARSSLPHLFLAGCCLTVGLSELVVGLRGSDRCARHILFLWNESTL
jgi:hypothetical protein